MVGGLFGLGLLLGLAFYIIRRRGQKAKKGLQLPSPAISQEAPWGNGPYMTQVPTSQQHAAPSIVSLLLLSSRMIYSQVESGVECLTGWI